MNEATRKKLERMLDEEKDAFDEAADKLKEKYPAWYERASRLRTAEDAVAMMRDVLFSSGTSMRGWNDRAVRSYGVKPEWKREFDKAEAELTKLVGLAKDRNLRESSTYEDAMRIMRTVSLRVRTLWGNIFIETGEIGNDVCMYYDPETGKVDVVEGSSDE